MKKKKSGSAILMVLMVSTVMIIISAAVSSSLVSTTVGNTVEKYKNDYVYAAEGGLELGIQRYKETGMFTSFTIPYLESISDNLTRGIEEVRVEIIGGTTDKFISSKAVRNENGIEKLLAEVRIPIGISRTINSVLENSIYSSADVIIKNNGSFDYKNVNITHNQDKNCEIEPSGVVTSDNSHIYDEDTMAPEFRADVITKRSQPKRVKSLDALWSDSDTLEINVSSKEVAPTNIHTGIGKFEIDRFAISYNDLPGIPPMLGQGYKVILVDAPKLIIDLEGASTRNAKYIVICSGPIEITSNPDTSTTLIAGTLYGNGVYITGNTSLQITGSPMNPAGTGSHALRSDQVKYLDVILSKYMTNWGTEASGGSGAMNGEINFDDVEYIIP